MSIDRALSQLERYSPEEAIAILEAVQEKQRKEQYIKYWLPYSSAPGKYDYQKPIFDQFEPGVKEVYIIGGNRSGKTIDGAAIAMAWLLGKEFFRDSPAWEWVSKLPIPEGRPRQIWVVGLDFKTVQDTILGEYFLRGKNIPPMLPKNWEALGFDVRESDLQIIGPDGSVLSLKSAESGREKFQSASVDLVWIDEEPDVTVYEECWQRTIDCNGIIVVTVTPLVDMASGAKIPWIYHQVSLARDGDKSIRVVQLNTLHNPTITDEAKQLMKAKWDGHPEENARLYGEFIQRSGLVYNMVKKGVQIVSKIDIHQSVYRIAMIDPAPSGPSACLWAAIYMDPYGNGPGDIRLYKEYKQDNLIVSEHAKNILVMNGSDPVDLWLIDPQGGNQRNAETHKTIAQLYRENNIPVRLAEVDSDYGLEVSREYLTAAGDPTSRSPKLVIEEDLADLLSELRGYVWDFYDRGAKKGQTKGRPRKLRDDLINCMQYICGMRPRGHRRERSRPSEEMREQRRKHNSYT